MEELCLRENKLDAKCLIDLGLVIRSAAHDLEDLDISNNAISIITDEDTAAFDFFLRSFAECYVLRRVDFGGNALGMDVSHSNTHPFLGSWFPTIPCSADTSVID